MISLKDFLPAGIALEAKSNPKSNLYKLIESIDSYVKTMDIDINELKLEMQPNTTNALIERWENEVGIPNSCFYREGTIQERIRQVMAMILAPYAYNEQGIINLCALWGFVPVIHYGTWTWSIDVLTNLKPTGVAPICLDTCTILTCRDSLGCLLKKIKPANTRLNINYVL